jgi:nucleotide-binding universal stress UspA family protein
MGEALGSAVAPTIGDDDLKQYALSGITDALDGIEIPDGVSLTSEAIAGHPSDVLVDLSHDASLVVVGSRGHGDIGSALIGSVGMHVIHHSECPVVVLPHPRRSRRSK